MPDQNGILQDNVNPDVAASEFRNSNADRLQQLTANALKRGNLTDRKVLDAVTGLASAYNRDLASYIGGANTRPAVVSGAEGDTVFYNAPSRVSPNTYRPVASESFSPVGQLTASNVPEGIETTPSAVSARAARVRGIISQPSEGGPVEVIKGAAAPVYTRDRRGNITGIAREAVPHTRETFDIGDTVTSRGVLRDVSALSPAELLKLRTAEATALGAETAATESERRFGPGGLEERALDIARSKAGARAAKPLDSTFISDVSKLLTATGVLDVADKILLPENITFRTYDAIDALATNYNINPEDAYAYFGLPTREQFVANKVSTLTPGISAGYQFRVLRNPQTGEVVTLDAQGNRIK